MAQKPAGASIPITNTNYRQNVCLSEKMPFEKVAEDFSNGFAYVETLEGITGGSAYYLYELFTDIQ